VRPFQLRCRGVLGGQRGGEGFALGVGNLLMSPRFRRQIGTGLSWLPKSSNREKRTMKKSKFSDEQITYALRQVDSGTPVADVCRQLGVSKGEPLQLAQEGRKVGPERSAPAAR